MALGFVVTDTMVVVYLDNDCIKSMLLFRVGIHLGSFYVTRLHVVIEGEKDQCLQSNSVPNK